MIIDPVITIILGTAVGCAVGLTGIGGGSLMTPLLLVFGVPVHIAVGTDLCYAAITKVSGVIAHHRNKNVNWRIVFMMATGSLPGVLIGIVLLQYTADNRHYYDEIITYVLGAMLIISSLSIFFHGYFKVKGNKFSKNTELKTNEVNNTKGTICCIGFGVCTGVLVTLSSVGAGVIGTAVLFFAFPAMLAKRVIGTEIAHAVPLTLIASFGHLYLGNVDFKLLCYLVIGSVPGVFFSTYLLKYLPVNLIKYILATMLLFFGVRYIFF